MMARKAATTKKAVKKKASSETKAESSAKTATTAKKKTVKAKTATKKTATKKRASRAKKSSAPVRLKAFWGVYSQTLKRVAIFDYSQRKAANKKAAELSTSQKSPHFVKLVKEVIE